MSVPSSKRPEPQIGLEVIQSSLDQLTDEERHCLKQELDRRLPEISDWLDAEYTAYAHKEGDPHTPLESLRHALAKIAGSMSEVVIVERFEDPEARLVLKKPLRDRLIRQQTKVATEDRGEDFQSVVARLGLP